MKWLTETLTSSLGKKLVVSLTGIFLLTFLIAHLAGNLSLFLPAVAEGQTHPFDEYAHFMATNPIIKAMEVILFAGFLLHIIQAIIVSIQNKIARGSRYGKNKSSANSNFMARNMIFTGGIVLIFLVLHLIDFFWERITRKGVEADFSLYQVVIDRFQDQNYVFLYIFFMVVLIFHLYHGFQSAFQTLGLNHRKYTPVIKALGGIYSVVIPLAFASIPIYICFFR